MDWSVIHWPMVATEGVLVVISAVMPAFSLSTPSIVDASGDA